jgi:hypothetical protein
MYVTVCHKLLHLVNETHDTLPAKTSETIARGGDPESIWARARELLLLDIWKARKEMTQGQPVAR